jgi:hypothetical protein
MIKTFRGLLADGGQDRIRLQTIKGKVGYRIVKFQIMQEKPGDSDFEFVCMIWKDEQSTVIGTVNFTNSDLLAVAINEGNAALSGSAPVGPIIFDNEMFNQDIYITSKDLSTGESCNYYLELEVIPLDDAGAEYTTLKDMRQA